MHNFNDIEKDLYYKSLKILLKSTALSNVEQIIFLSVFENWFHFHNVSYLRLVKAALSTFGGAHDEKL